MRRILAVAILGLLFVWIALPVERAAVMVETHGGEGITLPRDFVVRDVQFTATDGTLLRGWVVAGRRNAPTVVLVSEFKSDRMAMLPYARFLHAAGYTVLLYDSRGTGQSGGHFTVGVREVDDALGAIGYVRRSSGAQTRIGLLGVSLGAGVVIAAAAQDHHVRATVADSAYTDEQAVVNRLDSLYGLPLAPLGPLVTDQLAGVSVSSFRPIDVIGRIAPRAILLIHSRHDSNPTTPLSGALALRRAARPPVELWIAPRGDHANALMAQPAIYAAKVLRFFRRHLVG